MMNNNASQAMTRQELPLKLVESFYLSASRPDKSRYLILSESLFAFKRNYFMASTEVKNDASDQL